MRNNQSASLDGCQCRRRVVVYEWNFSLHILSAVGGKVTLYFNFTLFSYTQHGASYRCRRASPSLICCLSLLCRLCKTTQPACAERVECDLCNSDSLLLLIFFFSFSENVFIFFVAETLSYRKKSEQKKKRKRLHCRLALYIGLTSQSSCYRTNDDKQRQFQLKFIERFVASVADNGYGLTFAMCGDSFCYFCFFLCNDTVIASMQHSEEANVRNVIWSTIAHTPIGPIRGCQNSWRNSMAPVRAREVSKGPHNNLTILRPK